MSVEGPYTPYEGLNLANPKGWKYKFGGIWPDGGGKPLSIILIQML